MKVILRADLKGLGKRGDIVEVSDGHARNFLLPKGHALRPPTVRSPRPASMRRSRDLRDAQRSRERARRSPRRWCRRSSPSRPSPGPEGKLFGSVTVGRRRRSGRGADEASSSTASSSHMEPIKSLGSTR